MSSADGPIVGTICWRDLTVEHAEQIRDFYQRVVGWETAPVDMGGYSDFTMLAPGAEESVAGICHARGGNAELPPQWLMYIVVADVEQSAAKCVALGGALLVGPRAMGERIASA